MRSGWGRVGLKSNVQCPYERGTCGHGHTRRGPDDDRGEGSDPATDKDAQPKAKAESSHLAASEEVRPAPGLDSQCPDGKCWQPALAMCTRGPSSLLPRGSALPLLSSPASALCPHHSLSLALALPLLVCPMAPRRRDDRGLPLSLTLNSGLSLRKMLVLLSHSSTRPASVSTTR